MIVGHEKALSTIPSPLPSVLLLLGPSGVGKKRVATQLVRSSTDWANIQTVGTLTKETAKAVVKFHESAPISPGPKISLIDLSRSTQAAQNAVLKILEEPPSWSKFILHSDIEPPLTILSRCFAIRLGVLSDAEVDEVLKNQGIHQSIRDDAVPAAHGRVSVALDYASNTDSRSAVEAVLRALLAHDGPALERSLNSALSVNKDSEDKRAIWGRKDVVASLFARVIRTSLTDPAHPLARVDTNYRIQALRILESKSRLDLRVKSAVWTLAMGL